MTRVAVLVPLRGDLPLVRGALAALAAQDLPRSDFEILVALDGPGREREEMRRRLLDDPVRGLRPRFVENLVGGAAAGLDAAFAATEAEVLVRCDARARPAPDYLRRCVEALEETDADLVGGAQVGVGERAVGRAYAALTSSFLGSGGAGYRDPETPGRREADTVWLGAWRRSTFERHGPFDPALLRNQDDEFAMRIRGGGGRVLLDPAIRSRYVVRESLAAIARQHFGYGVWKPAVLKRHPGGLRARHLAPPLLVLGTLVAALGAAFGAPPLLALAGPGAVALGGALAAAIPSLRRGDLAGALVAPAVWLVLVYAQGAGFLVGTGRRLPPAPSPRAAAALEAERERLLRLYAARDADPRWLRRFTPGRPSVELERRLRREALLELGGAAGLAALPSLRVLEIGCGRGGWLPLLRELGAAEERLAGCDLLEGRIEAARRELPRADLRVASAETLPWDDGRFDLVVLATVLGSVVEPAMRRRILAEARRVATKEGRILHYDLTRPSRSSPRPAGPEEFAEFLGTAPIASRRCGLLPPLARALGPFAATLGPALARLRPLRSHRLDVFPVARNG